MIHYKKKVFNLFFRYALIILFGLGNLFIFYNIFTPITLFLTSSILSLFKETITSGSLIHYSYFTISLIPACIAGAAYYLLFILVFSTSEIKPFKRILLLLISFISFLLLNTLRIILLVLIVGSSSFELIHWVSWNLLSTVFVIGIWLMLTKISNIKSIPIYSDVRYLINLIKNSKKGN